MTVFPSAIKLGCFFFFYRGSGMMCVPHRKWKNDSWTQSTQVWKSTVDVLWQALLSTTDLYFLQISFCYTTLRNHSFGRVRCLKHFIELPFQKHRYDVNLNFGNQKVEPMTNRKWNSPNFIFQAGGSLMQALFTSCVTLWDFPQY